MDERFVTRAEIEKQLGECEYAVEFYTILRDALDEGKFVLFNDKTRQYRIVSPGKPIINC